MDSGTPMTARSWRTLRKIVDPQEITVAMTIDLGDTPTEAKALLVRGLASPAGIVPPIRPS
jgi:hypothetical protein